MVSGVNVTPSCGLLFILIDNWKNLGKMAFVYAHSRDYSRLEAYVVPTDRSSFVGDRSLFSRMFFYFLVRIFGKQEKNIQDMNPSISPVQQVYQDTTDIGELWRPLTAMSEIRRPKSKFFPRQHPWMTF